MATSKFQVSGRVYEFDDDPAKLMGSELLLVEEHIGDLREWGRRVVSGRLRVRDILVITYLAARRQGETRPWDEFVATVAPLTFQQLPDEGPNGVSPAVTAAAEKAAAVPLPADLVNSVAQALAARGAQEQAAS